MAEPLPEPRISIDFTPQELAQLGGLIHIAAQAGGVNVARTVVMIMDKMDEAAKRQQQMQMDGKEPKVPLN